jgi:hypothetical protein
MGWSTGGRTGTGGQAWLGVHWRQSADLEWTETVVGFVAGRRERASSQAREGGAMQI